VSAYTVESIHGCRVIKGSVPIGDMAALMKAAPEGALMDLQLAERIGATMVFGSKEALARLRSDGQPLSEKRLAQIEAARAAGLSEQAIAWLSDGERGRSSETLFSVLTRVDLLPARDYAVPFDPDDLARCRKLLESVPGLVEDFGRMADVGPGWKGLTEAWTRICDTMDAEAPQWRDVNGRTPETYRAIQSAIGNHRC
jgi:hypothetical protein